MKLLVTFGCCLFLSEIGFGREDNTYQKPSVLMVNIDDLNDWTTVLRGHPQAITPNLDRLAKRGTVFTNTICPSPVCFPSRTAIYSGIHPSKSGAVSNFNWAKEWKFYTKNARTLPKHLADNGWATYACGKNLHGRNDSEFEEYLPLKKKEPTKLPGVGFSSGPLGWAYAKPGEKMPDELMVDWGIKKIQSSEGHSLFCVGIYKPHVKWILPKRFFEMHPLNKFQMPKMQNNDIGDLPERLKLLARNKAKFDKGYHQKLVDAGQDKNFARAYLAAVTFADEQLGRLLDAWDASPHSKNGYIVLWSDHGFMLGEKGGWGKFKPWYDSCRSHFIIAGPGVAKDRRCDHAVSLLDLYPTLVSEMGIELPKTHVLDGRNLSKLIDPDESELEWDKPVVMSHEEDGVRYDVVLSNQYRMTRLITGEVELYDLRNDPHEFRNIAAKKESQAVIDKLSEHLTFSVPRVESRVKLEAESVARQTSAEYRSRGNYHYVGSSRQASGGKVLSAALIKGAGSYVEFVVDMAPGTYQLSIGHEAGKTASQIEVSYAIVENDAAQVSASYKTATLGKLSQEIALKSIRIEEANKVLIRLKNTKKSKAVINVDFFELTRIVSPSDK
ncbi:sulfatase-like hydrolase/transferase [Verrucomicrobiaceae bacterium N1E253]|uniref:Sulfatase-like hydrolase/transferase n=1 Tax=Oceaniferula marina TaxID=2748318 RepID=A0A851GKJ9_9BACT|nr:sulfatase-like hydrolase/transferase [Oceaniferula marina]NWK55250.1 sulfatase-like hydrolase/transferase [Oceaniferula marina]